MKQTPFHISFQVSSYKEENKENTIQRQYDSKIIENYVFIKHKLHYDLLNYISYLNYFVQLLKVKEKRDHSIILNSTKNLISLTDEAKNIYLHLKGFTIPLNEVHNYYNIYAKADNEFKIVIEDLKNIWKIYNVCKKDSNERSGFCNACYGLNLELTKLRTRIQVNINRINVARR